jgi:hypothetical protein
MSEIIALTACLTPLLSRTSLHHLQVIVLALLSMNGRVTMLGLSRWTEEGGSYRTLQRWFSSGLDWGSLMWTVVRVHLLDPQGEYVLAGDEVVVSKAGKQTHGLGRFYSSIAQHGSVERVIRHDMVKVVVQNAADEECRQLAQRQARFQAVVAGPAFLLTNGTG